MDSDIYAITQEWKELESCGFHCYVGKWVLYIYVSIFAGNQCTFNVSTLSIF